MLTPNLTGYLLKEGWSSAFLFSTVCIMVCTGKPYREVRMFCLFASPEFEDIHVEVQSIWSLVSADSSRALPNLSEEWRKQESKPDAPFCLFPGLNYASPCWELF